MAVGTIKECAKGLPARWEGLNVREYTRTFEVRVTAKTDTGGLVLAATGIPRFGDQYATSSYIDLGARCISVEHFETDSPYLRRVEARYSSESKDPTKQDENPLLRAADIDYSGQKYSKPYDRDVLGRAILNSAKQPFDPPLEKDDSRGILIITRNEPIFLNSTADLYQDAISSDAFFGRAAGTWKCEPMRARQQYENGTAFVSVTYEFHYRREGWTREVMDRGMKYLSNGALKLITLDGIPVTDPVPLNGKGGLLKDTKTTLGIALNATDTNLAVGDVTIFPTIVAGGSDLYVLIDDEVMKVSSVNSAVVGGNMSMVVVRAQLGTTAAAHAASVGGDKKVKMEPYYLKFQEYYARPFSLLNLP